MEIGKRSKNKSKKSAKQERVGHLKYVEECESIYSLLSQKIKSIGCNRDREVCGIYGQQLQLTLQSKQAYVALSKQEDFRHRLSISYSGLFFHQIQCQNYNDALESLANLVKFPMHDSFQKIVEPWKDLFLLRLEGANNDRIQRVIRNVVESLDQDIIGANEDSLQNIFVTHALFELSRQQQFEAVQYLSDKILQKIHEAPQGSSCMNLDGLGKVFFVYSNMDKLRYALVHEEEVSPMLFTIEALDSNRTLFELPSGTGHLAASLSSFYHFFCYKENLPLEKANEAMDISTKIMENYINHRSSALNMMCYTCKDEDTKGYELFVCQGCRVACYCCKDHQRLNYLHHENSGSKCLGHEHLCPVYKTFRKMRDNTDGSKDGHLKRKFQRACKRFILNSLKNIGTRRRR